MDVLLKRSTFHGMQLLIRIIPHRGVPIILHSSISSSESARSSFTGPLRQKSEPERLTSIPSQSSFDSVPNPNSHSDIPSSRRENPSPSHSLPFNRSKILEQERAKDTEKVGKESVKTQAVSEREGWKQTHRREKQRLLTSVAIVKAKAKVDRVLLVVPSSPNTTSLRLLEGSKSSASCSRTSASRT